MFDRFPGVKIVAGRLGEKYFMRTCCLKQC
jgi:hypothetical protein